MFDSLTDRFDGIFKRLRGHGRLGEDDVDEVLREIRLALLEADVNFAVVRDLVARIRERCVGAELHQALNPAQQVIDIVHTELIATLGGEALKINFASKPPTVVLMAGLQGSGKTTTSAKLARWFKSQGRNPMLVGADLQRPGRGRAAPHPRLGHRRAGVLGAGRRGRRRAGGPGRGGHGRDRRGPSPGSRRRHRGHRRSTLDRRGAHGAGASHRRRHRTRLHLPRRRRDDGPGRGHHGRELQRLAATRRGHPHQARWRRTRRRRAVGQGGRRQADRLRLHR